MHFKKNLSVRQQLERCERDFRSRLEEESAALSESARKAEERARAECEALGRAAAAAEGRAAAAAEAERGERERQLGELKMALEEERMLRGQVRHMSISYLFFL